MNVGDITNPESQFRGKPLDGIRVLAVEQMQSMPYATQLLARLGAEVVKLEHPVRGDLGRGSTPAIDDPQGRAVGATFLRNNLDKRSVGFDMKNPRTRDLFLRLVPRFDVVCENFKPGTMNSFGLGYEAVAAANPRIVYCSISGFGNTTESPYGHWPAFAPIAEAMSGLYNINRADDEDIKVSPVGALGDTASGLYAVIGILAALRHRDSTGEGQYVDIAMFDCMVAFADLVVNYWSLGKDPRTPTEMINHGFPLADGSQVVVQVGREAQFELFARAVGHPEWLADERFSTRRGWLDNIEVLRAGVREWAGDRTPVQVADALASAGIAAAPSFEAADVVVDPHVANRHMIMEFPRPDGGPNVMLPGNPVKLSKVSEGPDVRPPWLGEHTDEVLRAELGLSDDELAELRGSGAIG
jgi:formyl-CoA transferase